MYSNTRMWAVMYEGRILGDGGNELIAVHEDGAVALTKDKAYFDSVCRTCNVTDRSKVEVRPVRLIMDDLTVDDHAVRRAIEYLNSVLKIDPDAVKRLFKHEVPCNDALTKHPTCRVGDAGTGHDPTLSVLGLINGIFGVDEHGQGHINSLHPGDSTDIETFLRGTNERG